MASIYYKDTYFLNTYGEKEVKCRKWLVKQMFCPIKPLATQQPLRLPLIAYHLATILKRVGDGKLVDVL